MKLRSRIAGMLCILIGTGAVSGRVLAQQETWRTDGPRSAKNPVVFTLEPIFGSDVAPSLGWNEVVVTIDNHDGAPFDGTVENVSDRYGSQALGVVSANVSVPAHGHARLELPVHLPPYGASNFNVRVVGKNGEEIAQRSLSVVSHPSPTLIAWSRSPRLATELRGASLPISIPAGSVANRLRIGSPGIDAASGDPIVPTTPAAYGGVDAVLLTSKDLAHLQGAKLAALAGFVLAGGTVAVVPTRPEDLRGPPLATFVGGVVRPGPIPRELYMLPGGAHAAPPSSPSPMRLAHPADGMSPILKLSAPVEPAASSLLRVRNDGDEEFFGGPSVTLRETFAGHAGGNLRESRFGAVASYGLGEVHVLAFDALAPVNAEDRWVHARLVEIVGRAYNRRLLRALPSRDEEHSENGRDSIRSALDPNENFRGALGISALILVLYAILAGPVLHLRAQRRQKPLEPLVGAPFLAAGTFALLVLVGLAAKGFRGRARHLVLVEAGAGMTRATGVAYRGFFSSRAEQLTLRSLGPGAMLARTEHGDQNPDHYRVDRDGIVLENLAALPWQTVVVRESGFLYDMTGSVDIVRLPDGHLRIKNGLTNILRDAVLGDGSHGTYFQTIAAGATVTDTDGRPLPGRYRDTSSSTMPPVHRLESYLLRDVVSGPEGKRLAATWEMAQGVSQGSDFWSDDNPILIAEIDSPKAAATDSGLTLESERVLLRVVGEGGTR